MAVWDLRLCRYHTDNLGRYGQGTAFDEPIWAPLHSNDEHSEAYYAHMWLTQMMYLLNNR